MVVIIATLLSVAAFSLKPAQQANVKIEKMQNILNAAKIESESSDAVAKFNEHVTGFFFVKNGSAEVVSPADAGMTDTFNGLSVLRTGVSPGTSHHREADRLWLLS